MNKYEQENNFGQTKARKRINKKAQRNKDGVDV